jgi:hypothetical protein
LEPDVEGQTESKLVDVKSQASFLIANEDVDGINAKVTILVIRFLAIMWGRELIRLTERREAGHGEYYKTRKHFDSVLGLRAVPGFNRICFLIPRKSGRARL